MINSQNESGLELENSIGRYLMYFSYEEVQLAVTESFPIIVCIIIHSLHFYRSGQESQSAL